jgi:tRNA threonylcarbamoyl adenosine modification protein (Sua5/YciO/YrdC/YwlC family)
MKIISIHEPITSEQIQDKVFVYPTDTCYGIGCDALNRDLITRIYRIKERGEHKPLSIMVDSLEMFKMYGEVNEQTEKLIQTYLPGDLTIIVPKTGNVPPFLNPNISTIGIRIPRHAFSLSLIQTLGKPIITTSANKTGGKNPYTVQQIVSAFAPDEEKPDIIFDGGTLPQNPPSTIIEVRGDRIHLVRQGRLQIPIPE